VRVHADDLLAVVDAVAGTSVPVHIVGNGLGGLIAIDAALRRGSRVRSITLIATAHALPIEVKRSYRQMVARFHQDAASYESWASWLIPVWLSRDFLNARSDAVAMFDAMLARHDPGSIVGTLDQTIDHAIAARDLSALNAPTLVIYGTNDVFPATVEAEHLFGTLADVKRLRIPKAARAPHLEAPEAVNAALARHLGSS
jgi:pimeloyl-ACP methyl ester carboxylesterase